VDESHTPHPLLDHAQDLIAVVDEEGRLQYVNAAATEILGYEREEMVGTNAFDPIHPADRTAVRTAFDRLLEAEPGATIELEYRFRRADGEWIWFESRLSNERAEAFDGYVVSSREVTDRVESQRTLRELAAESADVHWMFTGDWSELLFVNEAAEDVYGVTPAELEANPQSFLDRVHPEDRADVRTAMERLSAGESVDLEYRVGDEGDHQCEVWVKGRPIVEDGQVVRVVGFSRDVTDRKRRSRHLEVMDDLLRHNLRNDLNVVLGHVERIEGAGGEPAQECLDAITETSRGLLAKADKQRRIMELLQDGDPARPQRLAAVVDDVLAQVDAGGATVVSDVPDDPCVLAVPQLDAAIRELVENALRHGEDPTVRLTASATGDWVDFAVIDSCEPIPDVEAKNLLTDAPASPTDHTNGLGLNLVYWTVELSDGTLAFQNREDGERGNRIRIRLRRADDAAA